MALSRQQRRRLQRRLRLGLAGVALLLALGLAPSTALAGTITVDGATCTLANAITTANTGTSTGGCTGGSLGADTINLTVNVSLSCGLPAITSAITLEGHGHTIQRSSAASFSVLAVTSSGNLTLKEATISGGSAYHGGGINNYGMVTVQNSTLSGNTAFNQGGGIRNSGIATLMVQNSTLSGNTGYTGGGIRNFGAATVQSSTLSGNSASYYGGGIGNIGTMTVQNSTLSGNSGGLYGGGINNYGDLTVQNSTLSGNSAAQGGGIRSYIGILDVQDSANLVPGTTTYYWLEDVSLSGVTTRHGPVSAAVSAPTAVTLGSLHSVSSESPGWLAGMVRAVQSFLIGLSAR